MISIPINLAALAIFVALILLEKWWALAAYNRNLQSRHDYDPGPELNTFCSEVTQKT